MTIETEQRQIQVTRALSRALSSVVLRDQMQPDASTIDVLDGRAFSTHAFAIPGTDDVLLLRRDLTDPGRPTTVVRQQDGTEIPLGTPGEGLAAEILQRLIRDANDLNALSIPPSQARLMVTPLYVFTELSLRTVNALASGWWIDHEDKAHPTRVTPYLYLGDIVTDTRANIGRIKNLGSAGLGEISALLDRHDLSFATHLPRDIREQLENLPRERPGRMSGEERARAIAQFLGTEQAADEATPPSPGIDQSHT